MTEKTLLLEALAAIEHERWAHWQQFMHDQGKRLPDGSLVLPPELIAKWDRLIDTPYVQLTSEEQESDRDQVRRYLPVIDRAYGNFNA
ncbi:hypothetical protein [Xanthomonas arboricola]|uniref:hypothetical protein n=1 Tax=Xanthomonas arboricola TaxID=56448 RepID=UPI000F8E0E57|nr:hypothetical protein [Xanthomonas arboricola]